MKLRSGYDTDRPWLDDSCEWCKGTGGRMCYVHRKIMQACGVVLCYRLRAGYGKRWQFHGDPNLLPDYPDSVNERESSDWVVVR